MKYGAPLLVDQLSGKVGGVVFSNSRSGPTIRVRVKPSNPSSDSQVAVRAAMTNASRQFKDFASADAAAWNSAAVGVTLPNGLGGSFHPSGISYYCQLATVFLAIDPTGTPPTAPPSSPFTDDTIGIVGSGGVGSVTFNPDAANTAGITTELLIAPLASRNRAVKPNMYRVNRYHVFASGADNVVVTEPAGYYALAYRFVEIATGQRGPVHALGTFQVT